MPVCISDRLYSHQSNRIAVLSRIFWFLFGLSSCICFVGIDQQRKTQLQTPMQKTEQASAAGKSRDEQTRDMIKHDETIQYDKITTTMQDTTLYCTTILYCF